MLQKALQQPTKCSCNHLHFYFATTYISGLQLSTFLFYNKQDKKKYYLGFTNDKGKTKAGTINHELTDMAKKRSDFQEADIKDRKKAIIDDFIQYVVDNGLSQ